MSHSRPVTMAFRILEYDVRSIKLLNDIYVDMAQIIKLAISCCLKNSHVRIYQFIDTYYQTVMQVSDDEDFDRWELKANYVLDSLLSKTVIHFEIMFKQTVLEYITPFNLFDVHSVTVNGGIAYVSFNTTPI